jgi:predicted NBD/HSP70 family sugar kinase
MVELVCTSAATNRAALSRALGMSRSSVGVCVDHLLEKGILDEIARSGGARGRPSPELIPGRRSAKTGVLEFGHRSTTAAIGNLCGEVVARRPVDVSLRKGGGSALDVACESLRELMDTLPEGSGRIQQVVVSIPASGSSPTGSTEPSAMLHGELDRPIGALDDVPVARYTEQLLGVPTAVESDANLLALAEANSTARPALPLVRLELSLGIGAGIIDGDGDLFHGVRGVAGDLSHIGLHVGTATCWCGKVGCFALIASLRSVLGDLGMWDPEEGVAAGSAQLRDRIRAGESEAMRRVWAAADAVGEVAAIVVDLLNPATLVLGGELTMLGSDVLARVRATIYERALASSTRHLQVTTGHPEVDTARGAALLGQALLLAPDGLDRQLAGSHLVS